MIPWLGSVTYEYWEIRHILAEILYKGSSQVTRGEKEEDDSRLVISWIERGGRFAISERVRWDINLEAETWSGGPPPRRRTMCFDERHLYTNRMYARREREREFAPLSLPRFHRPPLSPIATPTDLDHNANSRSVTSRCLRNKYHCSRRLDRTRRPTLRRNAPCPKWYLLKEIVQWAILKADRGV